MPNSKLFPDSPFQPFPKNSSLRCGLADLPGCGGGAPHIQCLMSWVWGGSILQISKKWKCKTNGFYMVFLPQTSRFLISVLIYIYIYIYIMFSFAFPESVLGGQRCRPILAKSILELFSVQGVTKMTQSRCVPCAALLSWTWRPGTDFGVIWGPKRSRDQFVSIRGSILTTFVIKCWWLGKGLASKNSNDNR